MRRTSLPIPIWIALAVSILIPLGCGDDCPVCSDGGSKEIHGTITAGANPLRAGIELRSISTDETVEPAVYRTESDSTGHYSIDVPPGSYTLEAWIQDPLCCVDGYAHDGTLSDTEADTILTDTEEASIVVDISLGSIRIGLTTPPRMNGREFQSYIQPYQGMTDYVYTTATAQDGHVDLIFPAAIPRRYRVRCEVGGTGVWMPGTLSEDEADGITVEAGKETVYQAQISDRAMLSGFVTGSWQRMSAGCPTLRLVDSDSTVISRNTVTENGEYQLWVLATVQARLAITTGYTWRWYGGSTFEEATVFDLHPGETIPLDMVLSGIAGNLGRPNSWGDGTAGLYDPERRLLDTSYLVGEASGFQFANLSAGRYYLRFSSGPSWIEHWYDHAESFETATPIVIQEDGEIVWVSATPLDGGSISGRVVDSQGRPRIGAALSVTTSESPGSWNHREIRTGENGTFTAPALVNGSYKLAVHLSWRETIWYPGVADWDSAGVITVEGYGAVTGIEIRLP